MSSRSEPHTRLTIAAPFPAHFFLENIAVRQDNSMLITVVQPKELYYLPPPHPDEEVEPVLLHTFDELTTGIAELEPDVFVVFTTNAYTTHENYLHRLDMRGWTPSAPAKPELIFTFPKATIALNGCCALSPKTVLAADSLAGLIWRVDFTPDGSPQTKIWLKHESMAHIEGRLPPPPQPGINGVRYSAKEEHVYFPGQTAPQELPGHAQRCEFQTPVASARARRRNDPGAGAIVVENRPVPNPCALLGRCDRLAANNRRIQIIRGPHRYRL
jgi:hypothetical protein